MDFPAVQYTAVSGENNTFNRPRQKMYGVFIISSVIETKAPLVPLNYSTANMISPNATFYRSADGTLNEKDINGNTNFTIAGSSSYTYGTKYYKLTEYNKEYVPPENLKMPTGETIIITKYAHTVIAEEKLGEHLGKDVYPASAISEQILYSYNPTIRNTGWDLVSTTNDLHAAKEMVNNWLRFPPEIPTKDRPRSGMNSVIICEILPADSIVEL